MEEGFFIPEWSDFFPIIGDKSRKSDMELADLATDECLSNFVRLVVSPPFKGYRENSIASGTRKETQEPRYGERK